MRTDAWLAARGSVTRSLLQQRVYAIGLAVAAISLTIACLWAAPPTFADPTDTLRAAAMSVRGASCGPLRSDPVAEETAEILNKSSDAWLDQAGRVVPPDDALPTLKDRGYAGDRAVLLRGAGVNDARAIKGLLLQGYLDIPDCSYTMYGASMLRNQTTGYVLALIVLAT